jgi:hypothetical protein
MEPTTLNLLVSFLPLWIMSAPMAIGAAYLAPKMGASRWLWVLLFLIPVVNIIAMYVFGFRWAGSVLDKLNELSDRAKVL